jgi:3-deoxy-manno-octulosonate cytidylyltransferase (CMP-KDO synthetase)
LIPIQAPLSPSSPPATSRSRLPGKALADIAGRPMIEHVYRRAARPRTVSSVLVATDDERIAEAVRAFGGDACMTSADHQSGTDRLAEVAAGLACAIVVNVQGDEPLIDPAMIDEAVGRSWPIPRRDVHAAAPHRPRRRGGDNPNVTKVVVDRDGYALYFSRAPIPFVRAGSPPARLAARRPVRLPPRVPAAAGGAAAHRARAGRGLEQLRALEHGIRIKAVETAFDSIGVDTPEDLAGPEHHAHIRILNFVFCKF